MTPETCTDCVHLPHTRVCNRDTPDSICDCTAMTEPGLQRLAKELNHPPRPDEYASSLDHIQWLEAEIDDNQQTIADLTEALERLTGLVENLTTAAFAVGDDKDARVAARALLARLKTAETA